MTIGEDVIGLLSRIADRAAPRADARRPCPGGNAAGRLSAILSEIAETILPRRLEFDIGGDARCTLTVNSGRVVDISGLAAGEGADRQERLERVAAALMEFAHYDGVLHVASGFVEEDPAAEEIGHTANELRDYCEGRGWLAGGEAEADIEMQASAPSPRAQASVTRDEGLTGVRGESALLPDAETAGLLLADMDALRNVDDPAVATPFRVVLCNAEGGRVALALDATDGALDLAVFDRGAAAQLVALPDEEEE